MSRSRKQPKREHMSGSLGRWWRRRFEQNLGRLVTLGALSPGLAAMLRDRGTTFDVFDDYREAVEGRLGGVEPGEVKP